MQPLPRTKSCFVCGELNPIGLKLQLKTDGRIVTAQFTPRPEHAGFKQILHGGITATLLDEVMVWASAIQTGCLAYCAELNVRYLKPVRLGGMVIATGELVANRRQRIFETRGEVRDQQGNVAASATGKYLPIKETETAEFLSDFVGDVETVLGRKL